MCYNYDDHYSGHSSRVDRESLQYKKAKKIVNKKKGFYYHLLSYLAVNVFLLLVSEGDSFPVVFAWGIGIVFHYFAVFGMPFTGVGSDEWKDREIQKEMKRLNKKEGSKGNWNIDDHLELKELDERYKDSDFV